jgi:3-hydroxybutyryl-CoA dehydrogenase
MLKIAVVGAGLMGHGIAQVAALAGWPVTLHDPSEEALASAPARVRANLAALDRDPAAADAIRLAADLGDAVRDADLVVEAAPEYLDVKRAVFARLDGLTRPEAILASNTSVISIGAIAEVVADPGRVLGTHWWNPPYAVPLVEVIQAPATRPAVVEQVMAALAALGKDPVHVRRDIPGFIGNRLQHALWREAFALIDAGVCDAETIDRVVTTTFGARMPVLGPMENADLIGLDLALAIQDYLLPSLDRSTEPSATLRAHVEAGELGMKTGRGLRAWPPGAADAARLRIVARLTGRDA